MVPKVLVFKSGERVIAGASEMTDVTLVKVFV